MEHFIQLLSDALEKDSEQINKDDKFRDYKEWDSLAVLSLIAMIKQNYNITIPRKDFDDLKTVSELFEYIQAQRQ
ncbi:MAG: acyl carrier protein [Candidatus Cloacimonas acidaminovorans]|jgi:acyl carrier protein|nr:acyl carrier protein [Candidatus Cloacimonas acidaminovorans]